MADRLVSPIERERTVVTWLLVLQLLLWLGFLVHRSPRFPGSFTGSMLGIAAAVLMVLPSVAYTAAKRISRVKRTVASQLPLRKLLAWHVYGGIFGSILAILHAAHRFDSTLGIALTSAMLLTVFSGYVGRHFLARVSLDVREKQAVLSQLTNAYNALVASFSGQGGQAVRPATARGGPWRWARVKFTPNAASDESPDRDHRAAELAGSIAELEHEIQLHEYLKRRFSAWLYVHVATSLVFYALLGFHVWAGVHFGLRWLP
jgi:hypothetical protein